MRLLGLDPGLRHTGWGIIDVEGSHLRYVADGAIHPKADLGLPERLVHLHHALAKVIADHRPAEAAVEETFVSQNAASTLKLGMARGVVRAGAGAGQFARVGISGQPDQEIRGRRRPCHQGPGADDGAAPAAGLSS